MSIFLAADITRFSQQAEQNFASQNLCIPFRFCLDIVSGTSEYTLSDYVLSIRQITYKGFRLDPIFQRDLRDSGLSGTQGGRPTSYIFNSLGQLKIQLFPVPNETIVADQSFRYSDNIPLQCIVECWRTPDFTTYVIPAYFRRRYIKAYVLKECFAIEGKGQNFKAVRYWTAVHNVLLEEYGQFLQDFHNKPRNLNSGLVPISNYKIPAPMLPIARFGQGVDL